ncbi:RNA polymerase sigma factor [Xanthocytophaga flava]|uniref:RNA polymerase sigma factor n=1 Tax=Xanthocytophaga flava TaxID=3048013 RepID=UPI0028D58E72|nr:sigma-70 family RNA polymerase sigma factor [Xanthocytophaga flavus]MDJ1467247.1 sigma-70 family RNA polymerase sigma factor [Xanthocytophaga flavus]
MKIFEDEYYIERVLQGDVSAYRFLVERYKKMVYSISLKILNDAQHAEDAAQDSFVKAYERLHTFERKSKFSTWLYTITYRLCLNKLKEMKREFTFLTEQLPKWEDEERVLPGSFNEQDQERIIKESIQALPQQEGLLVLLYYYEEKSIREIEQITGLMASNIKIKLHRARKVLERKLSYLIEER